MALKKPIIVCNKTGIDELIRKNNTGICINYSGEDFMNAVKKIAKNKAMLKELSENANNAYKKKYNWNMMEKELIKNYNLMIFKKN